MIFGRDGDERREALGIPGAGDRDGGSRADSVEAGLAADVVERDPVDVAVDGVSVSLGGTAELEAVSTRVEPGEFVGLVGPNGAGKTTLLRIAAGELTPGAGVVRVGGDDVGGLSSRAASRRVAVVPQDTGVRFDFTVREVVEMGRTPHVSRFGGASETDRRAVDRALERANVARFADRSATSLSGGERSRVLLARALAQAAPALLLDEPTASLDVNHQVETLSLVRSLADEGRTVVAAIHDLDLAARFCDRLVVLADGAVVADGEPSQVLTPDQLRAAFGADAVVTDDPVTGAPRVTAFPAGDGRGDAEARGNPEARSNPEAQDGDSFPDRDGVTPDGSTPTGDGATAFEVDRTADDPARTAPAGGVERVHVVAGGDSAESVIRGVAASGYDLSVGPVPAGDGDARVARELGAAVTTVPPLAGIDEAALAATRSAVAAADAIVVAERPLSSGLDRVLGAVAGANGIVLVESGPAAERASDEAALAAYRRLRARGVVAAPESVTAAVREARRLTSDAEPRDPSGVLWVRTYGDD